MYCEGKPLGLICIMHQWSNITRVGCCAVIRSIDIFFDLGLFHGHERVVQALYIFFKQANLFRRGARKSSIDYSRGNIRGCKVRVTFRFSNNTATKLSIQKSFQGCGPINAPGYLLKTIGTCYNRNFVRFSSICKLCFLMSMIKNEK